MGNIKRAVTKVDCQPMWDGGVIVSVIGQLQEDAEHSKLMSFSQVFILKSDGAAWFILHEIFRLNMHDF
ncbi:hypothetical protein BaRGS_00002886 [Batillaria attramentaria]|uniref:NTF2 domain-containing protein n=1 Tax=Batillaria attramentaria TaxID=370345 RepID=A0ABD0M1F8_9CAEN